MEPGALADEATVAGRSTLAGLLLTQVTFSFTSIGLALILGRYATRPKPELALLTGVLLLQGLARTVVGVNLPRDPQRSEGAMWPAVLMAIVAGLPFARLGVQWWLLAAAPTVVYEVLRSWHLGQGRAQNYLLVAAADVVWFLPSVALAAMTNGVRAAPALGAGGIAASALLGSFFGGTLLARNLERPSLRWWTRHRANVGRSLLEGLSGVVLPFLCVAALSALRRYDDTNALRAVAQVISPIGSLVGVTVFAWVRLPMRWRRIIGTCLVFAPALLALTAALVPGPFATLSGDSPYVMAYAFGWSAFGVSQTRIALSNADNRHGFDSRLPSRLAVLIVAAGLLGAGLTRDVATTSVVTLIAVVTVPWLISSLLQRRASPAHPESLGSTTETSAYES